MLACLLGWQHQREHVRTEAKRLMDNMCILFHKSVVKDKSLCTVERILDIVKYFGALMSFYVNSKLSDSNMSIHRCCLLQKKSTFSVKHAVIGSQTLLSNTH